GFFATVDLDLDGHKNPTFQEKFVFSIIEGLRELNVVVWTSNTVTNDDFIGSGRYRFFLHTNQIKSIKKNSF
ncbi:hypothetical protein PJP07_30845, partial [Mycobacterium kansasii]